SRPVESSRRATEKTETSLNMIWHNAHLVHQRDPERVINDHVEKGYEFIFARSAGNQRVQVFFKIELAPDAWRRKNAAAKVSEAERETERQAVEKAEEDARAAKAREKAERIAAQPQPKAKQKK